MLAMHFADMLQEEARATPPHLPVHWGPCSKPFVRPGSFSCGLAGESCFKTAKFCDWTVESFTFKPEEHHILLLYILLAKEEALRSQSS